MTSTEINNMANYILGIIRGSGGIFYSWGPRGFRATKFNGNPALEFRVQGIVHRGRVIIEYNQGADLFNVSTTNLKYVVRDSVSDVYVEDLSRVVDSLVERPNDWSADKYETYANKAIAAALSKI